MKPKYLADKLRYQGIFAGMQIRGTIGKGPKNVGPGALPIRTFRVRTGNGFYNAKLGRKYQDQYAYTVSDPNADHCGQVNKDKFADGATLWGLLTPTEKTAWKNRALSNRLDMTGYNLYMKKYLLNLL